METHRERLPVEHHERALPLVRFRWALLPLLALLMSAPLGCGQTTGTVSEGGAVTDADGSGGSVSLPDVPVVDSDASDAKTTGDTVASRDVDWHVDASQGETGWPCVSNDDCVSGWCVAWDGGNVCSNTCFGDDGCPDGWECREIPQTGPDFVFACHPYQSHLCRACQTDYECGGGLCIELPEGSFCGRSRATIVRAEQRIWRVLRLPGMRRRDRLVRLRRSRSGSGGLQRRG